MGFILATAGAAIGLGNLWKFPYLMGRNGGFPFLVAYLFFICILGVPVMITEMSLGRKTGKNPVLAYDTIHPHARIVGYFGVLAAFVILSYYAIIGGWIIKYFVSYATAFQAPADFAAFTAKPVEPLIWFFIFMLITGLICYFGVNGIEKASKFMMPALFVILIVIIIRGVTLPGAGEGLAFIFSPIGQCGSGTGLLLLKSLHGDHHYLWKLLKQRSQHPEKLHEYCRAGHHYRRAGGNCHLPGCICQRLRAGLRPQSDLRHASKGF